MLLSPDSYSLSHWGHWVAQEQLADAVCAGDQERMARLARLGASALRTNEDREQVLHLVAHRLPARERAEGRVYLALGTLHAQGADVDAKNYVQYNTI